MTIQWQIELTQTAIETLKTITDQRVLNSLAGRISGLQSEPEKQGKPLTSPLLGYRSLRGVGQRYRIIYKLDINQVIVYVVAVGLRKEGDKSDIYALAQRLMRLGLLDPPTP